MSLSEKGLEEMTRDIAAANNLPLEIAGEYALYIGDTPEIADDGRAIVRDESGVELARIVLPME